MNNAYVCRKLYLNIFLQSRLHREWINLMQKKWFGFIIITQICKRLSLNTIIRDKIGGTYFGKILTRRYKY
jgi:hypothetical protein